MTFLCTVALGFTLKMTVNFWIQPVAVRVWCWSGERTNTDRVVLGSFDTRCSSYNWLSIWGKWFNMQFSFQTVPCFALKTENLKRRSTRWSDLLSVYILQTKMQNDRNWKATIKQHLVTLPRINRNCSNLSFFKYNASGCIFKYKRLLRQL